MKKLIRTISYAVIVPVMLGGSIVFDAAAADLAALTQSCGDCHGKDGASTEPTIPSIGGMSETYITDGLAIYKDKDRPCVEAEYPAGEHKGSKTDMCKIAAELSDEDVEAVAKFYSSKPFVRAKQDFDPEKAARGKQLHESACEKCHEDGGSSADDDAGVLAGQWTHYLEQTFKAYSAGEREMPKKMKPKFEELDDAAKQDLLHFYASMQ
jgi:sulfide dehydrogenase cytochrome subunit